MGGFWKSNSTAQFKAFPSLQRSVCYKYNSQAMKWNQPLEQFVVIFHHLMKVMTRYLVLKLPYNQYDQYQEYSIAQLKLVTSLMGHLFS